MNKGWMVSSSLWTSKWFNTPPSRCDSQLPFREIQHSAGTECASLRCSSLTIESAFLHPLLLSRRLMRQRTGCSTTIHLFTLEILSVDFEGVSIRKCSNQMTNDTSNRILGTGSVEGLVEDGYFWFDSILMQESPRRTNCAVTLSEIGPDERFTQRKTLQTVWSKVNMVRIVPLNTLVVMRHV